MIDPEFIDEEVLKFMGSSHIFAFEQKERFNHLNEVSSKISSLQTAFFAYRDNFAKLLPCIDQILNITNSISDFSEFSENSNFSKIMSDIKKSISEYIETFNKTVITPTKYFKQKFEELGDFHQDFVERKTHYEETLEKYMNDGNPPTKQLQNKIDALVDAHKHSTTSFVNFYNKMDSVSFMVQKFIPMFIFGLIDSFSAQSNAISNIINDNESILSKENREKICKVFDPNHRENSESCEFLYKKVISAEPHFWSRITTPFTGTSKRTIQGVLYKKGKRFGQWKKIFAVVEGGNLFYAKNVNEYMKKKKSKNLLLCSVKEANDPQRTNCFIITSYDYQTVYQTMSQYDVKMWIHVIEENIIMNMNGNKEVESNKCADCGAVDATWISLNWGQYICSRCSGVHRSLGPVHSRVRSPTLDTIPKYQKETFECIKNIQNSNEFLEKNIGENKINAAVSQEERENFIKNKYVLMNYAEESKDNIMQKIEEKDFASVFQCICCGLHKQFSGFLPIHKAAIVGDPHILCLVALHTDLVDSSDENGWTPLTYAAYFGQKEAVLVLKELGACESASKEVPIWRAALESGNKELQEMFPTEAGQEIGEFSQPLIPSFRRRYSNSYPQKRRRKKTENNGNISSNVSEKESPRRKEKIQVIINGDFVPSRSPSASPKKNKSQEDIINYRRNSPLTSQREKKYEEDTENYERSPLISPKEDIIKNGKRSPSALTSRSSNKEVVSRYNARSSSFSHRKNGDQESPTKYPKRSSSDSSKARNAEGGSPNHGKRSPSASTRKNTNQEDFTSYSRRRSPSLSPRKISTQGDLINEIRRSPTPSLRKNRNQEDLETNVEKSPLVSPRKNMNQEDFENNSRRSPSTSPREIVIQEGGARYVRKRPSRRRASSNQNAN